MQQQGDVLLLQTNDNGDIIIEDGVAQMTGGLETAAYLSLFGGNDWWGNLSETDPAYQYRSETGKLLQSIPATSGNLRRIEAAAGRDLAWFISQKAASSVTVSASVPTLNRVKLSISIEANGEESAFDFVANWKSSK